MNQLQWKNSIQRLGGLFVAYIHLHSEAGNYDTSWGCVEDLIAE
jgi:hypothetical protein